MDIRTARPDDLDAIAQLTARNRRRLAEWSSTWWRPSAAADQIHPLWLQHLIDSDGPVVRVAEDGDAIVGCIAEMPQADQRVVDDLAVNDEHRWADVGTQLIQSVGQRPALLCVATVDEPRALAAASAGLTHVSSYWIRDTEQQDTTTTPLPTDAPIPPAPPHTFGGALDLHANGALAFSVDGSGLVVGSPPVTAPPVYDPGGTVCIVDRITPATDVVRAAVAAAGARGDVLINIVAATDDHDLQRVLDGNGFNRTVDVYRWP